MKIIENPLLVVQFRKPMTKRRRVRNKWAKDPRNWKPDTNSYIYDNGRVIVCHPILAAKFRRVEREHFNPHMGGR